MTDTAAPSLLVAEARVRRSERIAPSFVRVTLEAAAFRDLGVEGFDTRFKMIFPGPTCELPAVGGTPEDWYSAWSAMPDERRSVMRTYTIRDVVEEGGARLLVVDLVVHDQGPQGPACLWALAVQPGDTIQVIAPHRASREYGGTEFAPGERRDLLLVADETAVPALARILADVSPDFVGHAFVEVPSAEDIVPFAGPADIKVTWVIRNQHEHGRRLVRVVRDFLNLGALDPTAVPDELTSDLDVEVWETPRYSSSGEEIEPQHQGHTLASDRTNLYTWIAGESWMVKALRRSLVGEIGVDRTQVAFMGYWREGVSMKS